MSLFRSTDQIPRISRLSKSRTTILSVVDVGSTKICCIIAKLRPRGEQSVLPGRSHAIEVVGFGYQKSGGIKSGVIVDMVEAEKSIRLAVDQAEQSAGLTVDSLIVTVSAGRLASDALSSSITLGGAEVLASDIKEVLTAGHAHVTQSGRATLHAMPIGYSLDEETGIHDPEGMVGDELGVDMHVVSADTAPLRNLEGCLNRSHLSVDAMVAAPYASGLAALIHDEMEMGCACIDMGGGTTTTSIFLNGHLMFADSVAVGGNHATMDLARILSTPVAEAERIKVLHGSALLTHAGDGELVGVPAIGEDANMIPHQVTHSHISKIIRPRIEETFEMVRDRINRSGFAGTIGKRVVLTGGSSQLPGVGEVASRILGANARIGRPLGISGMPKTAKGPAFSATVGMLIYPQVAELEYIPKRTKLRSVLQPMSGGAFGRVGQWLKESF